MIQTIYRVNGKEFTNFQDAENFEKKIEEEIKVHCSSCNELIDRDQFVEFEVDFFDFSYYRNVEDENILNNIYTKGEKFLCPQCRYKFVHQLEEYKNLIEKLFGDFNLRKQEEPENKKSSLAEEILNIEDPNSMINQYLDKKDKEAKEWISNKEKEPK